MMDFEDNMIQDDYTTCVYVIEENPTFKLVLLRCGTIAELYPCGKLFSTGEAIGFEEFPLDGWKEITCQRPTF